MTRSCRLWPAPAICHLPSALCPCLLVELPLQVEGYNYHAGAQPVYGVG